MHRIKRKAITIDQNEVHKLKFKKEDVLNSSKKKKDRRRKLSVAVMRKNKDGGRVSLTVQSAKRGLFIVDTFLLMAGKEYVMLSGGNTLPVRSIKKINL